MPDAIRYTVQEISNIASAFTRDPDNRTKIIAALASNPSIVITTPETRRY